MFNNIISFPFKWKYKDNQFCSIPKKELLLRIKLKKLLTLARGFRVNF